MNKHQQSGYVCTTIWNHFPYKRHILLTKYERWRKTAKILNLSREAQNRLEWIIYYFAKARKNARLTCRRFGIAPKTFYKWLKHFDEANLRTLEDRDKAPNNKRQKEFTPLQYERIIKLRRKYG